MLGALIAKSAVRKGFAAVARRDLDAIVSVFAEDAVVIYPTRGSIKGKDAIREFYRHFFQTFPKTGVAVYHVGVENIFDLFGTNVIFTRFEVSTTNRNGVTFQQEGMQLINIERGKLTLLHYFFFDTENLRRAWRESE